MDIDQLRDQTCTYLQLAEPELGDSSALVDECLENARAYFKPGFICELRPETWARITLAYHKYYLETGCDVSVSEIFAEIVRDAIGARRLDHVVLKLTHNKRNAQSEKPTVNSPNLRLVNTPTPSSDPSKG